jgi:catechol 2,3-dioxygenase-like lactoylglutathione lyase family enzyme
VRGWAFFLCLGKGRGDTLGNRDVIAFVPTVQSDDARDFYERVLGLKSIEDSPFALYGPGTMLRIQKVEELQAASHTALGRQVPDMGAAFEALRTEGVRFERFEGLAQDDLAIWTTPEGTPVAWFEDPSENMLSLRQFV